MLHLSGQHVSPAVATSDQVLGMESGKGLWSGPLSLLTRLCFHEEPHHGFMTRVWNN